MSIHLKVSTSFCGGFSEAISENPRNEGSPPPKDALVALSGIISNSTPPSLEALEITTPGAECITPAEIVIKKIMKSEKCASFFSPILESELLSPEQKIKSILHHLKIEQAVFKLKDFPINTDKLAENIIEYIESYQREESIADAQINFAYELIGKFIDILSTSSSFNYYLKHQIENTIQRIESRTEITPVEKADELNKAITEWINTEGNPIKNIKELSLTHRNLKAILPCICELPLDSLNLSHNLITSLPNYINRLTRLKRFNLEDNRITFIPDFIKKLANLKHIYLRYNRTPPREVPSTGHHRAEGQINPPSPALQQRTVVKAPPCGVFRKVKLATASSLGLR